MFINLYVKPCLFTPTPRGGANELLYDIFTRYFQVSEMSRFTIQSCFVLYSLETLCWTVSQLVLLKPVSTIDFSEHRLK